MVSIHNVSQTGGTIPWDYTINTLSVDLYQGTKGTIQRVLEIFCIICLIVNVVAEIRDVMHEVRPEPSWVLLAMSTTLTQHMCLETSCVPSFAHIQVTPHMHGSDMFWGGCTRAFNLLAYLTNPFNWVDWCHFCVMAATFTSWVVHANHAAVSPALSRHSSALSLFTVISREAMRVYAPGR
eukprot:859228-Rhodomonas_salina.1